MPNASDSLVWSTGRDRDFQEAKMVRLAAAGCGVIALIAVIALPVMYYVIWKNAD
jgi:hypothetical protein